MPNYRRYRIPGGTYFFTVNLLERQQDTLVRHIDLLRNAVRKTRNERPFHINAWVVLPDHLHCIWTLPPGESDYSVRWNGLKGYFSRHVEKGERISGSRKSRRERGLWQRRFWEHLLRNQEDFNRHVDYIHWNPVKHGWVNKVRDLPKGHKGHIQVFTDMWNRAFIRKIGVIMSYKTLMGLNDTNDAPRSSAHPTEVGQDSKEITQRA